jgi:hypothetical protein
MSPQAREWCEGDRGSGGEAPPQPSRVGQRDGNRQDAWLEQGVAGEGAGERVCPPRGRLAQE